MIGYIALPITIILAVIYSLLGYYVGLLTIFQLYEMIFGTIFFCIVFGFGVSYLMNFQDIMNNAFIISLAFINWYFITKTITNSMTRDNEGIIRI